MYKKFGIFMLIFALVTSAIPVTPIFATDAGSTVQNPVLWSDVPDVDVIRVGDSYYMTSTTMHMNPGVPIMKSNDLINWEIVNYVYDILGDGDNQALRNGAYEYGKGSWASSIKYDGTYFYITFASNSAGKTFIFQTKDIENGPWVKSELSGIYHDQSFFIDDDKRMYLVYGSGDIKIKELEHTTSNPESPLRFKQGGLDKIIITNASAASTGWDASKGGLTAEGSHIQKINGKYYIFNISWPAGYKRTEIVHRADTIDGTYEGKTISDNGVAQGGMVDSTDGKWYGLFFKDSGAVGRIPYLCPAEWTSDGWPSITSTTDTGIQDNSLKLNIVQSDEFNQKSVSPTAGSYHTATNYSSPSTVTATPSLLDPSQGTEILVNGGFENGQDSWTIHENGTVAVSNAAYVSGSTSILTSGRKTTGTGPQQSLTGKLKSGHTYYFSAKVKYEVGPDTRTFNMNFQDGDWQTIKVMGSVKATKGQWATIQGTYAVPATATLNKPLVFLETSWTSAQDPTNDLMDFYADDVSFKDITSDGNILTNGNIENGQSPWAGHENCTVSVSNTAAVSGSNSLLITGRKTTGSGPQQSIKGKVQAGRKYKFSAKVRYDSGPATRQFIIDYQDGDWTTIKNMGSVAATKGQWATIEATYTVPTDALLNNPLVFIETSWTQAQDPTNDLMDFYVDDVSMIDVTPTDSSKTGENDDNGSNLGLVWQWNHNPDNLNWSLLEHPGYLRLKNGRVVKNINYAKNTLTQRTFGPECSGNTAIDISNMKDGDYAGLAAFENKYGFIGVKMSGTNKSIVLVNGTSLASSTSDGPTPTETVIAPITQNKVYFKIDFDFKNQTDKAYFYYSIDGSNWIKASDTPLQLSYDTIYFMGVRFGLFNFATKSLNGYVDFDYFRVNDKMTGTTASTQLNASLEGISNVMGIPNTEFQVPVKIDALPVGQYTSINASFTIPKDFIVTGVDFNTTNITGDTSYTYTDNQLKLNVSGSNVNFINNNSDSLFATIKLKVKNYVSKDTTTQITTDYINIAGGNIVYNVQNAVANIELKAMDKSGALAKIPGYSNPLRDYKLGADPYAITYNGRVYIYMSSDELQYNSDGTLKSNDFANLDRVFVMSSSDMVNWTDEGAIPVAGKDGRNNGEGIAKWAGASWAPAAAHKVIDGKDKFFLYFANGASGIGVLTADSPTGPWSDPVGHALVTMSTPGVSGVAWLFDPAVLVDDDGTGYLYFGGGIPTTNGTSSQEQCANPKTARVIELGADMISVDGSAATIDSPFMFEDSGIHKYNGKYYYSYCMNFSGSHPQDKPAGEIAYMVSDNPMGPFTWQGSFLKNPSSFFGVGGNNHHSVFEFNDQWYIVYHAQTVAKLIDPKSDGYRSPHINKVEYYSNGQMKPVQGDYLGISQLENLNPYNRTEAETIGWNKGITTEECTAPRNGVLEQESGVNLDVTSINNGDWLAVSDADFGNNGAASLKANVASTKGGKIEVHLDSVDGDLIGTLNVDSTGDNQEWKIIECNLDKSVQGIHSIFFKFTGEGTSNLFNFDYWQFSAKSTSVTGIKVDNETLSLAPGNTAQLNATVEPSDAVNKNVTWTSSDESVATVDNNGKVIAVANGTAAITATTEDGAFKATCSITVTTVSNETPILTEINPTSGSVSGGTSVIIKGENFIGATSVKFGDNAAESYIVNSEDKITAITPAGNEGIVDVIVTTEAGTTTGSAVKFTYYNDSYEAPVVKEITPASGPTSGGTSVKIKGENFIGVTGIKFGINNSGNYTVNSEDEITAITPAGDEGTVDVIVTTEAGTTTGSAVQFTYIDGDDNNEPSDGIPTGVRIKGTEKVGNTLIADLIDENGNIVTTSAGVTYEWYRSVNSDFEDAELVGEDSSYKLVSGDAGKYIKLIVNFVDEIFEDITSKIAKKSSSSSSHHSSSNSSSNSSNSASDNSTSATTESGDNNGSSTDTNGGTTNTITGAWQKSEQGWKYIENNAPVTGWKQVNNTWYLMDSTGVMQTGWQQENGAWYLLKGDGAMATGWQQENGAWYLLKGDGAMATGWQQENGAWYLLKDDGAMATGWQQVNGKWYYLYTNGSMASNTVIDGYTLDESGAWI